VDLNRDFADFSQAESRNVAALMQRYRDEIDCVMDLHCAGKKNPGLWYQFNVQAKNAATSFKCINHIAECLKARGYEKEIDLSKIPGKYVKSNAFLQGYAYNELGLANIVVEHNLGRWYEEHSAEAFAYAVECYGNFIIQTGMMKLPMANEVGFAK
jgi:predicted deacylase